MISVELKLLRTPFLSDWDDVPLSYTALGGLIHLMPPLRSSIYGDEVFIREFIVHVKTLNNIY